MNEMRSQAEANLWALLESTDDLIWSVDLDFRLIAFNRAFQQHLQSIGVVSVALGMMHGDLLPPQRAALWPFRYEQALALGSYRDEVVLRDGRILEVYLNCIRVNGKTTGISVFGKDISDRKAAEQARALLASIVESSPDAIHAVHFDGTVVSWNAGCEKLFGYTSQQIVGQSIALLAPEGRAAEVPAYLNIVAQGNCINAFDTVLLDKKGVGIDISLTLAPIRNAAGEVVGASGIARDIRQRKAFEREIELAEEALRESLEILQDAQIAGSLGHYVLDFKTGVWSSSSVLDELLGIDENFEHTVAGCGGLLHPDDRAAFVDYFRHEVLGKGSAFNNECRVVRQSDHAERWIHVMGRVEFDILGAPTKIRGIVQDITERKQAERALIDSERLFRAMTETSPLAVILTSAVDDKIEYLNPTFARLFGYAPEEVPTVEAWMALAYPDADYQRWVMTEWQRKIPRSIDSVAGVESMESVVVCKDGSKREIAWGLVNLGDRLMVYGLDFTERKRAMDALRESEAQFRNFFENNGSVMLLVEPDEGRIVAANRAAASFYGYSQGQLSSMFTRQISTSSAEEIALDRQSALHKEKNRFDYRHRLASGELRDIEMYSSPYEVAGKSLLYVIVLDVSERKRAEEALRDREESLRESQAIAGLGSYVADFKAGMWTASDVMKQLMGMQEASAYTIQEWADLVAPEDRAMMVGYLQDEVLGKGKSFDKEYRVVRQTDKAVRWVNGLGRLTFDAEGKPILLRGTIQDITERKLAESQLREREERYRATFEQAAVGIVQTALDGTFLRSNARFAEIVGYPLEEVPGLTLMQITLPEEIEGCLALLQQLAVADAPGASLEKRYIRKDGTPTWVRITSTLQHDSQGRPLHHLAMVEDINVRKAAEELLAVAMESLRLSEDRYRSTFEQAAVGILHTSFEGRILRCNARFAEIVGYAQDEVPGLTFQQLTAPEDLALSVDWLQSYLRGDLNDTSWQKRYLRKDGSQTWVKMTISVQRDAAGCALHFVALVEDINDLKAAEKRLDSTQEALRASEARYRTVFQTSQYGIGISRLDDGTYLDVNQAALSLSGYEREEVIGRTSTDLGIWFNPADRLKLVEALKTSAGLQDLEIQFRRKNGEVVWGLMSASMIDLDGIPCVLSSTREITETKLAQQHLALAQEALRASEARYRTAFQTSHDGVAINRLHDGVYIDVNLAFLEITGFDRHEIVDKTSIEVEIWADPNDRKKLVNALTEHTTMRDMEAQFKRKNGTVFWGLMSASVIEIDGVTCVLSITRDISDAKVADEAIRSLAFYDPLTALPNRRLLLERLQLSLTSHKRSGPMSALLFVDLDNFKTLNDTLGHPMGDLLLQETARRLSACVREGDIVARLGGDEFVVMLEGLSPVPEKAAAQAEIVGEKILAELGYPYLIASHDCRSTASIGVALFGDQSVTMEEILQRADIALYQAKSAGRNTMRYFAKALQTAVHARAALEKNLRTAIQYDQFLLYYQPQLENSRLVGAEALIRWKHPERGILLPGEFIGLAEETGLILPLGNWILETACKQIALWGRFEETKPISLAVNISARQLHQSDFVAQVLSVLERTGASPFRLKLELTESMLVENVEEVIAKMTELRSHGLRFSLDDFGTGYSSLSYLKRLPLEQLKIDRSFVRDILVDASSGAIAQTIIALGKAMGLPVIAEGVETEEQRLFLESLGCHAYQGYLFSRPLPLEEFELLLPSVGEKIALPLLRS